MKNQNVTVSRQTLRRLYGAVSNFLRSSVAGHARLLLVALLILMLGINGMNVANSYVGRYFMSAIESRDSAAFVRFAWIYLAVFASSTLTGVLFRFAEERLGLLWREWLTRRITGT
jgi:vitamin B12/bleomycin/antimicrobial peptide transport system ATP-binding/permease protein